MVDTADKMPVLFLWHHHQPFYHGPHNDLPMMPWVRLHAVRGYMDMISAAEEAGAAVTFNFSPSLLEQLALASERVPCDEFERVSLISPGDLSADERRFVLRHFFSINWTTCVLPVPRYRELLAKRGEQADEVRLRQAVIEFSLQDYLDLIALFNLSWIGFAGRRREEIAQLWKKGRGFDARDIELILKIHHLILESVIPAYRRLLHKEQIELSVSPYSHAILPLLCDTSVAAPDIPKQSLPKPEYRHPEDASRQLQKAVQTHAKVWGVKPQGLWPSEGSVSEDMLDLTTRHGFAWTATDQGVLARSDASRTDGLAHFFPYLRKREQGTLRIYFRDHSLSDAIGFRYSGMTAEAAVEEFVGHLGRIEEATRALPGRCTVIAVDGENPWESFPDSGELFLQTLYNRISKHSRLKLCTFSAHAQPGFRETIRRTHAGSWIDSSFRIWIGDPEKNQAWSELERARRILDDLPVGDDRFESTLEWLDRALCSDWVWWYGEPFSSDYKPHFDELFRGYLKELYAAAGRPHPPSLDIAISIPRKIERRVQPVFPVAPIIDGYETSFFEWIGSCRIDTRQYGTTMGRSEHIVRSLWYGFGEDCVYFRFDPGSAVHPHQELKLSLHILGQTLMLISIPLQSCPSGDSRISSTRNFEEGDGFRWATGNLAEVSALRERLGLQKGGECQFWVEVREADSVIEKLPPQGAYRFVVPSEEALAANWIV